MGNPREYIRSIIVMAKQFRKYRVAIRLGCKSFFKIKIRNLFLVHMVSIFFLWKIRSFVSEVTFV